MAYIKYIEKNTKDSHQMSPAYVLTFVRWDVRDVFNNKSDTLKTRKPLIVISDAIQITVNSSKKHPNDTVTIILKPGDINYATAVHPGDFILVNLLKWDTEVIDIYNRASNGQAINKEKDGFKGIFKIQTVRKQLTVDSETGAKNLVYVVVGAAFTEFNTIIYYNPAIEAALKDTAKGMYSSLIGDFWAEKLKANASAHEITKSLFAILLGNGVQNKDVSVPTFGSTQFNLPSQVADLLGRKITYACDLFNYKIGVWGPTTKSDTLSKGMTSIFTKTNNNMLETSTKIAGNKIIAVEDWNRKTAWSIIQANCNELMNEIYTGCQIDKTGHIMPTIVVRQKPFNNYSFTPPSGHKVTNFLDLPRWKISSDLLLSLDLGRDEASRVNFVQLFGTNLMNSVENNMAYQITKKNYIEDKEDIKRNGLRTAIMSTNFDLSSKDEMQVLTPQWASIVGDWYINGHLKESGTINYTGIQDPICVGDNIQLGDTVYHIEAVTHTMAVRGDRKSFRTTVVVSSGIDSRSSKAKLIYPEMEHTDYLNLIEQDYKKEKILPAFGESQNIPGRKNGEEVTKTKEKPFK